MKWSTGDRSNVDDQRASSGLPGGGMTLGIGGFVLLAILSLATGRNFFSLVPSSGGDRPVGTTGTAQSSPQEERLVDFVDAVMRDLQSTWKEKLADYEPTRAVLFRDAIQSACGFTESATGPFYCPADRRVYLDLGFFDELRSKFGAPGDFAEAYVLAHEVGHHIQALTGIESKVREAQQRTGRRNELSVKLELQADCFAGVWGHEAAQPGRAAAGGVELEAGDAEEGLNAAAAIGDDRLQRMATGHVMPDRFTHGTSAERVAWFKRGLDSGSPDSCNTFSARTTH